LPGTLTLLPDFRRGLADSSTLKTRCAQKLLMATKRAISRAIWITLSAIIVIAAPFLGWWWLRRPLPPLSGIVAMPRLDNPVLVHFDAQGIPYIDAKSEADAYQAQGYLVARERMFQMDMLRRAAAGELSEVFGSSAVPADRLMRTIGIRRIAEEEQKHLTPLTKAALEQYCLGVNRYLSANADQLALEFSLLSYSPRAWKPADTLAVMKYIAYELDESWKLDDLRLRVKQKVDKDIYADLFRDDWIAPLSNLPPSSSTAPPAGAEAGNAAAPSAGSAGGAQSGSDQGRAPTGAKGGAAAGTSGPRTAGAARRSTRAPAARQAAPAVPTQTKEPGPEASLPDINLHHLASVKTGLPKRWIIGSTAVAVSPARSTTGGALLACEKHELLTVPPLWFSCSMKAPGFKVAGATIPGVPGIMIGRNSQIGWASANLQADVQDLFVEQFDSQSGQKVRGPKGWEPVTERTDVIPVRWGRDVEHRISTSERGTILFRNGDTGVALAWTGFDATRPALNTYFTLNHSQDWTTFRQSLFAYADPPQVFVYADRSGNIGSCVAGRIPVRAGTGDGTIMANARSYDGSWSGAISPDRLPFVTLPASDKVKVGGGVLVAANQMLGPHNIGSPTTSGKIYFGKQWNAPYRANRLLRVLEIETPPAPSITLASINTAFADQHAASSSIVRQQLEDAITRLPINDSTLIPAIQALDGWDGQLKPNSMPASFYETFFIQVTRRILEPKLGADMTSQYLERWPQWSTLTEHCLNDLPPRWLSPQYRNYDTFLLGSFTQSAKQLRVSFLNKPLAAWGWGDLHLVDFTAPLNFRSPVFSLFSSISGVKAGGDDNSNFACDLTCEDARQPFRAKAGPASRIMIDMQDDDKMYQLTVPGQSGNYLSTHRDNQLAAWLRGDMMPVALSQGQLEKQTKHKLILNNSAE
jgi:penicillin amidase